VRARGKETNLRKVKYDASYPDDILAYFRSFLGYWERRLEELESRLAAAAWAERAQMLAERQRAAFEKGEAMTDDVAMLLDPESIKQSARTAAYRALMEEMRVKRRLQGLPELVKWANRIGVTTQTIRDWRRKYPRFDAACEECMEIQAALLRDGGLSEVYASKMVTFLLETVHARRAEDEEEIESDTMLVDIDERAAKEDADGDKGKETDG
jgi:hypothetical protein